MTEKNISSTSSFSGSPSLAVSYDDAQLEKNVVKENVIPLGATVIGDLVLDSDGNIIPDFADPKKNKNIFKDPKVADYYSQVYERSKYECREAFDPEFEWTDEEEKKVLRKVDVRVTLWACIMFIGLQIDRGNLSQAVSDNMLDDLNLTTNDYNRGNMIFYLCFLSAEIPSQMISKLVGPDRWIPVQMCLWSIVAMSQGALKSKTGFFVTRALLALLEGGFIADMVLYLSYYYTSSELTIRLSFFWTSLSVCGIVTSLLAFAILRLRGVGGLPGWAWLFILEGAFTLCIGLTSFFFMPPSAVQTKTWFRPNGWFTEREEKIVVNRVLRDDPSKGDLSNRTPITLKALFNSLCDYHLYPIYLLGLISFIPQNTSGAFMTLTLRHLGFSTLNTNLLTIPSNVLHIITLLALTKFAEVTNQRLLTCLLQPLWILPCLAALRWWPGSQKEAWGTWALMTVLLGYPYCHAILVSESSSMSGSVRTRGVSSAVYNMFVQAGSVVSTTIYLKDDAPLYHRGNTQLFAITIAIIVLMVLAKVYYVLINRHREKIWGAMTQEERHNYLATTTDRGNRRLDFRFIS